jgi:hypothetical protein
MPSTYAAGSARIRDFLSDPDKDPELEVMDPALDPELVFHFNKNTVRVPVLLKSLQFVLN